MNTAEILDKIFEIYKKSLLQQILWIVFMAAFTFIFVLGLVIFSVFISLSDGFYLSFGFLPIFIFLFVFFAVLLLISVLLTGSMLLSRQIVHSNKADLGSVFRSFILPSLRVFTAYAAVASILFLPIFSIVFIAYNFSYEAAFLSVIAIFPITLIVSCITCCAIPAAVYEKRLFFGAVRRSASLTKGSRFKIFGVILIWNLVSYAISISLTLLFSLLAQFASFINGYSPAFTLSANGLVSLITYALIMPFSGIMLSVLYYSQRITNEGFDITLKLRAGDTNA